MSSVGNSWNAIVNKIVHGASQAYQPAALAITHGLPCSSSKGEFRSAASAH